MPYNGPDDSSLPSNVQQMSTSKKKQWVAVFNQAVSDGKKESEAFKLANGVVKKGYVESLYDVDLAQVSKTTAGYDDYGAKAGKGCANCQFFMSPDTCLVVAGDVSPT